MSDSDSESPPPLPQSKSPAELLEEQQQKLKNSGNNNATATPHDNNNSDDDDDDYENTPLPAKPSDPGGSGGGASRASSRKSKKSKSSTTKSAASEPTGFDEVDVAWKEGDDEWSEEGSATYGYAICSYTPPTEKDGLDELEFTKGQKFKLYNRHKNGWWRADMHHRRGHIITGYVSVYFIDPWRYEADYGEKIPSLNDLSEDELAKLGPASSSLDKSTSSVALGASSSSLSSSAASAAPASPAPAAASSSSSSNADTNSNNSKNDNDHGSGGKKSKICLLL